jgi:hypothetical protein
LDNILASAGKGPSEDALTKEEIDEIEVVKFGQNSTLFTSATCTICFEDFAANEEVKKLSCCHMFHKPCIEKWLLQKGQCPNCKKV